MREEVHERQGNLADRHTQAFTGRPAESESQRYGACLRIQEKDCQVLANDPLEIPQ